MTYLQKSIAPRSSNHFAMQPLLSILRPSYKRCQYIGLGQSMLGIHASKQHLLLLTKRFCGCSETMPKGMKMDPWTLSNVASLSGASPFLCRCRSVAVQHVRSCTRSSVTHRQIRFRQTLKPFRLGDFVKPVGDLLLARRVGDKV